MIVCRKPLLYDADLFGVAGLVLAGLAAWWLVVVPWQRTWASHRELGARHAATELRLHDQMIVLEQAQAALGRISAAVNAESGKVPRAAAVSKLLRQMTELAGHAQIELLSVAPQPAGREGNYVTTDIQVSARGRSRDFIVFLDRFAGENPYQALQKLTVTRPAGGAAEQCELAWVVRLYTLPEQPLAAAGGQS